MIRKGANSTAAMAFQMASTNLVAELGIILALLVGWQFTLAEFIGAPLMVALLVVLFRKFLNRGLLESARRQADKSLMGRMEGRAEMDMAVTEGTLLQRVSSAKGFTAISHYFVMNWVSLWVDVGGGLLIAGALAAVRNRFWQVFFLTSHPLLSKSGYRSSVPWLRSFLLSVQWAMFPWRPCCGTEAAALEVSSHSFLPTFW